MSKPKIVKKQEFLLSDYFDKDLNFDTLRFKDDFYRCCPPFAKTVLDDFDFFRMVLHLSFYELRLALCSDMLYVYEKQGFDVTSRVIFVVWSKN